MKNSQKGFVPILIILLIAVIVGGGIYYLINTQVTSEPDDNISETPTTLQVHSDYSFKTAKENDLNKKYPEIFVEIYKDNSLVKKVSVIESGIDASHFLVSPDGKYVAFKTVIGGGPCVYVEEPKVIDLKNFSFIQTERTATNESAAANISSMETITSMDWVSNNQFRVNINYGEEYSTFCGQYATTSLVYTLANY